MALNQYALLSRGDLLRTVLLFAVAIAAALWVSFQLLQPIPPRTLVLASGAPSGLYHKYAERYRNALAREGVTLVLRETRGAGENHDLLLDPKSGVDIAFMQGGVAPRNDDKGIVMLASLYYEPLWIFHRDAASVHAPQRVRGHAGSPSACRAAARACSCCRCSRPTASRRTTRRSSTPVPTRRFSCWSRAGPTS